jgi:RNA polymerase sigma factor (sigma-70 family)
MPPGQKLSNEDLKQLLPRCIYRDEAAWEAVFNGLYGLVKYIVLKVVKGHRSDEDIDDAIADAFRNIVDSIAEIAEAQNPIAYIGAVARNAALARARRVTALSGHEVSWSAQGSADDDSGGEDGTLPPDAADQPTQGLNIMTRNIDAELERLRSTLSEDDRRILHLKYAGDYTYEEMAYILARESGALRVAVHRAVKHLRVSLNQDVREAVLADPRLLARVGSMPLEDRTTSQETDARLQLLLEDYVDDPDSVAPSDREEVEVALLSSTTLREKKVLLERQLDNVELDVTGHSILNATMPGDMLRSLMQHALDKPQP